VASIVEAGILTLELDLVLDNKRLSIVVDGLGELGRDGMMGSLVLDHETLVTLHALQDRGLFHSPLADVGPFLVGGLVILLSRRDLPARFPVVGELLEQRCLELGGLVECPSAERYMMAISTAVLTVKVGFGTETVEASELELELDASSARTKAAASRVVAPIAKRIVAACCV
jgi:hypothetical protein